MVNQVSLRLALVGLLLVPVACTRLPEAGDSEGQAAALVELPSADEVPAEWGRLVAVTQGSQPRISVLWFEDESGTIRSVGYDANTRRLWSEAAVVRRR